MPDPRDPRSVVEEAEQAAAAGDYPSAERLLREAAVLQEASLGPFHPDLANTLNNLGIVCEMLAKPEDAERFYRRAYAVATAALEPDDSFVATSRKNLVDFCEARGIAVEPAPPAAEPAPAPQAPEPQASSPVPVPRERPVQVPSERQPSDPSRPLIPSKSSVPLVIGAVVVGVLIFALIMAVRPRFNSAGPAGSPPAAPTESPATNAVPKPAAKPVPLKPAPAPNDTSIGIARSKVPPATRNSNASGTSAAASPLVVEARVCKDLSTRGNWSCDRPVLPVSQGAVFFYTRLKSERDTTVQHRWYRGDRLEQTVDLRVQANPADGYRTYSRRTIYTGGESNWKVELRTKDGVLLHEERFTVR